MSETNPKEQRTDSEFVDRLVHINRVAKVVKGGRRFGFAALVVVGDQSGRVGFGHGKAREVPEAVRKATDNAKRGIIRVPLREGRTLHHDVAGQHGAGKVLLRTAPPGTGVIAGGALRAVFETLGLQDIVAKSIGSSNPYNMLRATFQALQKQSSPRHIAMRRGLKVSDIVARRQEMAGDSDEDMAPKPATKPVAKKAPVKKADKKAEDKKAEEKKAAPKKAELVVEKKPKRKVAKVADEK